ncbi:hypothetical protein LAUMK191_01161 [Mycobacterium attenuatum]|uniref:Serine/threonine-protein kinase PknH n=2 Tax=Mycobacterium attenuatum TaxID=2341086 RepID=A0A498PUM4_9MYCO|nr:hypothetical protein LAUMK136_01161 [Mycobacterium attenuatum]VBA48385.1 hypothetical protein LAUMK191_01161 [Mycobacterium attenuatum]
MSSMLRASRVASAILMALVATIAAASPARADALADLLRVLPAGYGGNSCKPADSGDSKGALAAVNCRDNSLPGGPTSATYWLFGDSSSMYDAFNAYVKGPEWAPATCPGMQSPEATAVRGSDGKRYGLIACGRGTGTDWQIRDGAVAWTRDADHFFGVAYVGYQGQAYPTSLFNWIRAQQIQSDCAASGGTYSAWRGGAGINYSHCCFKGSDGKQFCDEYVDGAYQGRSPG